MSVRKGKRTIIPDSPSYVAGSAVVAGKKEGEGPLKDYFDKIYTDEKCGSKTFEKAEMLMQREAAKLAMKKAALEETQIDCVLAGDLLNQCVASSFGFRDFGIPFAGLYGACSTMALSLALAALLNDSGAFGTIISCVSSHFCTAERQYRTPLEYGGQRTPTAQWTVTGAGAAIIRVIKSENEAIPENAPKIKAVQIGKICDLGVSDASNMGAAMAPAAADTISNFLADTKTAPENYDMILTGDLGLTGSRLLKDILLRENGVDISGVHNDCGLLIFDREKQDVHSGGSGCGCSASVLCSYIFEKMRRCELRKVLFVATGALLSPTTSLQGESVPGIAHAVLLEV